MEIPSGFLATLWAFLAFLPFFALLLLLGAIKAIIFGPAALLILTLGNSAVIVGLWPVHLIWTYYCIAKTKRLGPLLKIVLFTGLPVPLILWLVLGIIGSIFVGIGYGVVAPLMATFEAVGEERHKFKKCFVNGTWSTILGSCTVVRDFADVCYHSYFSTMDDILNLPPKHGEPSDIKLSQLPGCILVGLLGLIVDVPVITVVAIYKAPFMLVKGWQRLFHDLIGRVGPFLETACVPFAALSILLWPLVVTIATSVAILSSIFLGIYGAAVVYQETSIQRGFAYIVAAISLFDEYSNDLLDMQEGSCFPRPSYRNESDAGPSSGLKSLGEKKSEPVGSVDMGRVPQRRPSFNSAWQELKAVQVWDSLFSACEVLGKDLIKCGAIRVSDLDEWKHSSGRIINVGLPAYVLLKCFLRSIECGSVGFVMRDGKELTHENRPEGRVFDWFFEPMTTMKEQLRAEQLQESEKQYLCKLVLTTGDHKRMEAWQNGGVQPAEELRKAQLEALCRRMLGFSTILSRMPTFRRRFQDVVKALYQAAHDMQNRSISGCGESIVSGSI